MDNIKTEKEFSVHHNGKYTSVFIKEEVILDNVKEEALSDNESIINKNVSSDEGNELQQVETKYELEEVFIKCEQESCSEHEDACTSKGEVEAVLNQNIKSESADDPLSVSFTPTGECPNFPERSNHVSDSTINTESKYPQCDYITATTPDLRLHFMTHHHNKTQEIDKKLFECTQCNYSASTLKSLTLHKRLHTGEKIHKCSKCEYSSTSSTNFKMHYVSKHTDYKPFKCEQCDYSASTYNGMKLHMKSHMIHKCPDCDYVGTCKSFMEMHHKRTHIDKSLRCKLCSFSTSSVKRLISHENIHTIETPYKCTMCEYVSHKIKYLNSHMKKHEKIKSRKTMQNH